MQSQPGNHDLSSGRTSKTSDESNDGGQDGGEEAVAKASKEGAEASNKARQETSQKADEEGEDVGDEGEDGGEQRDELGAEAKDSNERLDGEQELGDKNVDKLQDLVNLALTDGNTSSVGKRVDKLSKVELGALDLVEELAVGSVLGHVAILDLGNSGVCDDG